MYLCVYEGRFRQVLISKLLFSLMYLTNTAFTDIYVCVFGVCMHACVFGSDLIHAYEL